MAETMIKTDRVISLSSINGEEDLKPTSGLINLNPPPADGKCNCCGRHLNELKPFGKAGDPLVGDFDGALLVKKYRTALPPPDTEIERIYERFLGDCGDYEKAQENLVKEYGEKDAEIIMVRVAGGSQVGSSWECRDCIVLDMDEFFEKVGYDLARYREWKPRLKENNSNRTGHE